LKSRAYANFLDSLRAEKTKQAYCSGLADFMRFMSISNPHYDKLLLMQPKELQEKIIDYVKRLRERKLAHQTIRVILCAVRHFCIMNDVTINWPKIYKFVGERTKIARDRSYTKEEIRRILEKCDERKRVMFLLLLTGMRIGALPDLRVRHLKKWREYGIYQITVYEGTTSEYTALTTPEIAQAIDDYLEYRKRCGEDLTSDAPLVREQFALKDANDPKSMTLGAFYTAMKRPVIDSGVREPSHNVHKRREIMLFHGFRKYVNTVMNQAGVKPVIKEMLLGHSVGLEASYYRPTEEEIITEFVKAFDLLTISEEKTLSREVERLKTEKADIDVMKQSYLEMKMKVESKDAIIQNTHEQLGTLFQIMTIEDEDKRRSKLAEAAKGWIERGMYLAQEN
jgi:integrase